MAASSPSGFAVLSRRFLYSSSLNPNHRFPLSTLPSSFRFFTTAVTGDADTEAEDPTAPEFDPPPSSSTQQRVPFQRPLENGLDPGVYKAILVGKVGQSPVQKQLKSGRSVVLFSIGTGGIRNNRRPFENENPIEYAGRCAVQWHRVSVYPERLGGLALQHVKPGCILYLEGNLETKVFADPMTGLVRRLREVAIRQDGRLVFVGANKEAAETEQAELRSIGYY